MVLGSKLAWLCSNSIWTACNMHFFLLAFSALLCTVAMGDCLQRAFLSAFALAFAVGMDCRNTPIYRIYTGTAGETLALRACLQAEAGGVQDSDLGGTMSQA